ncbi:hypothetical protein PybrP1_012529 [[Pythium] brassicae (nom. inval.)]|nr:hypothetical protein PybrP1_012529 [[Pythium] brassicae (nom. inval.)]
MELLVWHEGLGCDDEQASDAELLARVLFFHSTATSANADADAGGDPQLHALRLAQALLAFTHGLSCAESPKWLSVTLSRRRFFLQEVEPQIFMALGVQQTAKLVRAQCSGAAAAEEDA